MLTAAQDVARWVFTAGSRPREDSAAANTNYDFLTEPHLMQIRVPVPLEDGHTFPA